MDSYVYVIENLTSSFPTCYVGKANDPFKRFEQHLFKETSDLRPRFLRSHLTNAIKKYGIKSFKLHVVEKCSSEIEAFDLEKDWISYLRLMNVVLYNKSPGGYGGQQKVISELTKRKMSLSQKKRFKSDSLRNQISQKLKGRIKSDLTRKRLSLSAKKRAVVQMTVDGHKIQTFPSAKLAEESTGASRSKICECCKGCRQTAAGFKWRYECQE